MKKIFTLLFISAFYLGMAQLPVSQTAENKKVILEEFTGKTCTFCPDGHKRANELKEANPGNVFLINIHAGGYATGTPNYRTNFGTAIANGSDLEGYPAGSVNRTNFPGYEQTDNNGNYTAGSIAQGRTTWATTAATVLGQASYVNVALDAEIDVTTNVLTVNVEAYYTGDSPESTNKLNVAITQDDIWGPQTGATSFYPENIDPSTGLYKHSHMLRHLLTGQWGETISTTTQGTLVSETYTYTLPAIIGDVDMDVSKLNIVAFVSEGNRNVISGGEGKPVLTNLPNNLEAEMISLSVEESTCDGIVSPKFNVRNFGQQEITEMDIIYSVNGGTEYTFEWSGAAILPGYNVDIDLPQVGFSVNPSNDLNIRIETVNGTTDDVTTNNAAVATITGVDEHMMTTLTIEITPDDYADETGWALLDASGAIVDEMTIGTWTNGLSGVQTFTVPMSALDCYTFEIYDSYGDGLVGQTGDGTVNLKDQTGAVIYTQTGADFSSVGQYNFTTVDAAGNGNGNGDGSSVNPVDTTVSGISNINNAFAFELYPNPANDVIYVDFDSEISSITLANVLGEVVLSSDSKEINVSKLTNGVYFLTLIDTKGSSVTRSFVKKNN